MEDRKRKEIEHYDAAARQELEQGKDFEGFSPSILGSYQFLYKVVTPLVTGKKVLDYGCGNGVHSGFLAEHAVQVVGIDLSETSLEVAKKVHARIKGKVSFLKMDCEALEFPKESFDVVFDGGAFSSLDFSKAIKEIVRVLKSDGVLVGIETFGHNPFANAKRMLNRFTGKRTSWATSHIITQKEIEVLREQFNKVEVHYFHLISLFVFPFLSLPGSNVMLQFAERIDTALFSLRFLQKYAFKVVFICKKPRLV
ncbi:class I SAM-dependent methyltransferase [Patescibacteria group bacterium]|nr:class I SAM-dependent methyltransferase [Patescibacteria group bacterium]